jgi:tetratricopeptide (TPR) repeat protein
MQLNFGHPGSILVATQAFDRARALHKTGRLNAAIAAYRQAIALRPEFSEALCSLGIALKQSGRVNEAIAAYRRAIAVAPDFSEAHFNLGIVLDLVRSHTEAASCYKKAIKLKPNFAEAYNNLGKILHSEGSSEEAVSAFEQAIVHRPDHLGTMVNLSAALSERGQDREAIEVCQAVLERDNEFAPALEQLAKSYLRLERADQALATAQHACKVNPKSLEAVDLIVAALKKLNRDDEIAEVYHQSISLNPEVARAYHNFVLFHLERDDLVSGLEVCNTYLQIDPGDTATLAMKTTVLAELGHDNELSRLLDLDGLIEKFQCSPPSGYDDMESFNAALSHHVLAHPSLARSPRGQATRAGWHTGSLLIEPKGPIAALENLICTNVDHYRSDHPPVPAHPFLNRQPRLWNLEVWSVVLGEEGHQIPHIHPSAWLSGVYYVEVPSTVPHSEDTPDGWIEFGRSKYERRPTAERWLRLIRPEPSLMVLFPSYFYHCTRPSRSEERRISIAFDILPDTSKTVGRS